MNARSVAFVFLLCTVAAIAFAIGRVSEAPRMASSSSGFDVPENPQPTSAPAPSKEINVVDIARLPFPDAFAALKTAPPEVLSAWVEKIQAIKPSSTRWSAISSFFKTLIQIDPETATKLIGHLSEDNRWTALMAVKTAAPPRAMGQIVDLLQTFPILDISGCSFDYLRDAFAEWSAFDPVAAGRYFDQHSKDKNLSGYVATVVEKWAAYDPESAQKWAERQLHRNPDETASASEWPYPQAVMTEAWVEGYLRHDRPGALDYIVKFQDRPGVKQAIPNVAGALFRDSPNEAMAFLQRLPEEGQAEALRGISWVADRKVYSDADAWKRSPEFVANWMLQFPTAAWSDPLGQVITEWRYGDTQGLFA